jgi:hypothetical protein
VKEEEFWVHVSRLVVTDTTFMSAQDFWLSFNPATG